MQKSSFLLLFVFFISLTVSAESGEGETSLLASKLKNGSYSELLSNRKSVISGEESFIYAMAAYRLDSYNEAAALFKESADSFSLMKDYALYFRAKSLEKLERGEDALKDISEVIKMKNESVLFRRALIMRADLLFSSSRWKEALEAYSDYITTYPSGSDSLKASFNQAACRSNLGDKEGAAKQFSVIWLKSPASKQAQDAEAEIDNLLKQGVRIPAYTQDELYKRAVTLYDRQSYSKALEQFAKLSLTGKENVKAAVKTGQTLFKMRKFREAEEHFAKISGTDKNGETLYWLARSMAKNGKSEDSISTYLKLVHTFPTSDYADDSLYLSAIMRREGGKRKEAEALFRRLIAEYPKSGYYYPSIWETGVVRFLAGDNQSAYDLWIKLLDSSEQRERALYWLSEIEKKTGGEKSGYSSTLLKESPYGFYAYTLREKRGIADPHLPDAVDVLGKKLAVPSGFEKEKFMMSCGMNQEVQDELKRYESKQPSWKTVQSLAWLYLNTGNYNSLYHLSKKSLPFRETDSELFWPIAYPPAFMGEVKAESKKHNLPFSLAMAVMRSESSYNSIVISPAGAVGLMQIMPATAGKMMKASGKSISEVLKEPEQNIRLGVRHLKDLLVRYNGEKHLALAAYNAGSGNLDRWRKDYEGIDKEIFIELIPFSETRNYVKKVLAASFIYQSLYSETSTIKKPD